MSPYMFRKKWSQNTENIPNARSLRYNKAKGRKITIDVTRLLQMKIAICDDDIQTTGRMDMLLQKIAKRYFMELSQTGLPF